MKTRNLMFVVLAMLFAVVAVPCLANDDLFTSEKWTGSNEVIVVENYGKYAIVIYYGNDAGDGICIMAKVDGDKVIFDWWSDQNVGKVTTIVVMDNKTGIVEKCITKKLKRISPISN